MRKATELFEEILHSIEMIISFKFLLMIPHELGFVGDSWLGKRCQGKSA